MSNPTVRHVTRIDDGDHDFMAVFQDGDFVVIEQEGVAIGVSPGAIDALKRALDNAADELRAERAGQSA